MALEVRSPVAGERVLVIAAHPDDVDFGAGGTVASWTGAGSEVAYCIVTDGDAGGFDLEVPRERMAALRRDEQRAAATELGVEDVTFLGYPDGCTAASLDLRRDLARAIRRVRPDRVVTQSPDRNWERIQASHPDHLAVGEAAMCAVYPDSRNPFAFPELLDEGLEPHTVPETWLVASPSANAVVDVTGTFERKLAALKRHVSQVGEGQWLDEMLRGWLAPQAAAAGLPEGSLAESFRVVRTG